MLVEDTITAIATPRGIGAIAVIRISGKDSYNILRKLYRSKIKQSVEVFVDKRMTYGYLTDFQNNEIIDEVMVVYMKSPYTFTMEDTVEINCHGGAVTVKRVLEAILAAGARLAEPGEFTKRAFLNGRIDLAQAEAVIDLINAKTQQSSKASLKQLQGNLSITIKNIRQDLISIYAHLEAAFDYPEHDIEEITVEKVIEVIEGVRPRLKKLMDRSRTGKIIKDGIRTAIIGKPNVGKSSLLNTLTGEDKAIVTDIPGTTRDIIEEYININGLLLRLIDTAGIRKTSDKVEIIGVNKATDAIADSELVIFVVDAATGITSEDRRIAELIEEKAFIVAINKIDVVNEDSTAIIKEIDENIKGKYGIVKISAKNAQGIEDLVKAIEKTILKDTGVLSNLDDMMENNLVLDARHADLIRKAYDSVLSAKNACECRLSLDCIAVDVKEAVEHLGLITGENVREDMLNEIFKRFCIGK